MGAEYVGRHRREVSATQAPAIPRPSLAAEAGSATFWPAPRRHLRRPLVHAGLSTALAVAAVVGYLSAAPIPFQSSPDGGVAMDLPHITLATEVISEGALDTALMDREFAQGRVATTARAHALSSAAAAAAAAEQARLDTERRAEAERVARDAQRAAILANAQKDPKAVARAMVADRGWNDAQFQCLVKLWQKESNWTYTARNRSSGAYGIPQSLPGSKMASAGADWQTNPATQIRWGLGYIAARYGTPCSAWGHSQRVNWY